jgi:HK97 family phage prohead protease
VLHKAIPSIAADVDPVKRTVVVYFSKFGNVDLDGDMIMPGSYTKTIQEQGKAGVDAIWHLTDHTGSLRSAVGKPLLEQDNFGLKGTTQIVDTTWGNDVLKLYEAKLINQHSVGYRIVKDGMKQGEVGGPYNEITELKLYEGSAVLWGANPDTPTVELKSAADMLRVFGLIEEQLRKGTLTDDTFRILQKHYDAIGQALKTLKATEPVDPTQPVDETKGKSIGIEKGFFTDLFTN